MPVPVNIFNRVFIQMTYPTAHKKSSAWASMQSGLINDTTSASLSLRTSQTPASLTDLGNKKH